MSGHYPGFSSPNHQGNYPNQMVNQQMRNMPGVMGPMMNMQPNQMVNPMMGQQQMNYNQQPMPNPGNYTSHSNISVCSVIHVSLIMLFNSCRYGRTCKYARRILSSCITDAYAAATKYTATTKFICNFRQFTVIFNMFIVIKKSSCFLIHLTATTATAAASSSTANANGSTATASWKPTTGIEIVILANS